MRNILLVRVNIEFCMEDKGYVYVTEKDGILMIGKQTDMARGIGNASGVRRVCNTYRYVRVV